MTLPSLLSGKIKNKLEKKRKKKILRALSLSLWLNLFYKSSFVTFYMFLQMGEEKRVGLYTNDRRFVCFWTGIMVKTLSISREEESLRSGQHLSISRSAARLLCRPGVSVMPGQQPTRWSKQPEGERSTLPDLLPNLYCLSHPVFCSLAL